MKFVDVPRWHKILTFLAAELPPMPPSETPWVGKLFLKSRRRGVWRHKNSNLDRNAYDLKGFMWIHRSITVLISPNQFALRSFCLRDRGRLRNRGRPIWLKFGTRSYYGDLCNMPKFKLHCSYLGWVIDVSLFGVPQCFFFAHFGHFSILWLQYLGYFKPNINSPFIISILKGFIANHMDQRNISVACEIIVKLMLLKASLVKLKITQI